MNSDGQSILEFVPALTERESIENYVDKILPSQDQKKNKEIDSASISFSNENKNSVIGKNTASTDLIGVQGDCLGFVTQNSISSEEDEEKTIANQEGSLDSQFEETTRDLGIK